MKNVCKTVFITLVLIFLYAPILILTVYSFTDATTIGAIGMTSSKDPTKDPIIMKKKTRTAIRRYLTPPKRSAIFASI